jgi:ComF family protein
MWKDFFRVFISNSCYGCDRELTSQERLVCLHCLSQMQPTGFERSASDNELYYRLAGKVPLQGAAALFYFDKGGILQKLVEALKYKDAPQIGVFFGEYYAQHLQGGDFLAGVEAIVPVPLHLRRRIQRGYNQAERFAAGLSQATGIPVQEAAVRRRYTLTQTRKSGAQRWGNVAGAFQSKGTLPGSVLLVDDVITTGSTLEALIRALLEGPQPPQEIRVAAIATTRQH